MSFNKICQTTRNVRSVANLASGIRVRSFSESGGKTPSKISAAVQVVKSRGSEEVPMELEPVLILQIDNVRSKINEFDQRKLRQQEYAEMLKKLISKPDCYKLETKLPFKKLPSTAKSIRTCSSVEEVLEFSKDHDKLAKELLNLSWDLRAEKRKYDILLENYMDLKQKLNKI